MEIEIKLSPVGPDTAAGLFADRLLAPFMSEVRRINMESVYYDLPGGELSALRAALRMRLEDVEGVCCLKIQAGSLSHAEMRQEFEVRASGIREGAALLAERPDVPQALRELLSRGGLAPVCGCSFLRTESLYSSDGLSFILSYDTGEYYKGPSRAPLGELELELREGRPERLNQLCSCLVEKYGLTVCCQSKYARAMALDGGPEQ